MATPEFCTRVNQLLVELSCSLLQYTIEVSPWSTGDRGSALQALVERLARDQRQSVQRLADFLDEQGVAVDFGVYPDEYSSLHFVALDFLLNQLVVSEQGIVGDCDQLLASADRDTVITAMLTAIRDRERRILTELQQAAKSRNTDHAH